MEKLDIERINKNAPYKESMGETKISYCFTTCHGVHQFCKYIESEAITG